MLGKIIGRNCTLFDRTRKWAYRAIRQGWPEYDQWLQACYERARVYNLQFSAPLDENEVNGIAKSIAKWTHGKLSKESFDEYVIRAHSSEIQSVRGKRSKRNAVVDSEQTIQPWIRLGISRATYYRRKRC
ncbi:TPA: hypothetical protein JLS18_004586 [Escherichia coli]|nr:hypothetical protein [Salmonella enterica]EEW2158692.1 hypothetical protein [Escherichia coli]EGE4710797.1 hypothetical protein [Salmonella enterica subsp. enterica serovar Hadar]EBU4410257.1 hypothetical protein [Salmonella enterica]EHH8759139.1 hypothetical protein [Escherichia coli]